MRTKTQLLIAALFVAGMISAMSQSNPSSTNATDVEIQLAWPDGRVYFNGIHDTDNTILVGTPLGTQVIYNMKNWGETTGGAGEDKWTFTISYPWWSEHDDFYNWSPCRWPEFNNLAPDPMPPNGTTTYGSVNFVSSNGDTTYQFNDQGQVALITGGLPGSTENELYQISGWAVGITYTDQSIPNGISTAIAPEQIQVGNLGNLTTTGTNGWIPYGTLWAALPMHTQVPLTPYVSGSQYKLIGISSAQGYQLVSQCVATTPANRARTTIGVGEQVNLYFNPTLPTNAIWSTTAGGLSSITNTSTQFTAPSNAANATVTATVAGKSVSMAFKVVAPSGIVRAQIIGTNSYPTGVVGAGMTNLVWIGPTNVSFYRVNVMEVGEDATNIWGYYSQWTPQQLHHSTADHWTRLNSSNQINDSAYFPVGGLTNWSAGGFEWNIPQRWQVDGSGVTNSMTGCNQIFSIDSTGTARIDKYGNWVQRTTNNAITTN